MRRKKRSQLKLILIPIILIIIAILIIQENKKVVICLDAGHGGKDVGSVAANNKRYEKEDNLEIVLQVKKELEKQHIKVILTREEDTFVTLEKRCQIANFRRADYFVSIHRNSSKNGDGIEIWIGSDEKEKDKKLADSIMKHLAKTNIQTNRGVKSGTSENKEGDYFVNKNTKMPSCLIELGFISNAKDNELLDENLEKYAQAIAKGILENLEQK